MLTSGEVLNGYGASRDHDIRRIATSGAEPGSGCFNYRLVESKCTGLRHLITVRRNANEQQRPWEVDFL